VSAEPYPVVLADVTLPFRCVDAGTAPGPAVAAEFDRAWPSYRRWFLHLGEQRLPAYADCRAALTEYMPELVPDFDALVAAVGGGDLQARFLSHWCPPPLVTACSIATITHPAPLLVRNYDYPPLLCDALALRTHWSGRSILGMADCGWGLMDGVNDAGLAVAISFGGRRPVGVGFGIGLIVRYVLQVAASTAHACDLLARLPVRMSYNVAVVDSAGDSRIALLAPDRPPRFTAGCFAANSQGEIEWPRHAEYSNTREREEYLASLVAFPHTDTREVLEAFLRPPLYRPMHTSTWGTVYTAAYEPVTGLLTLRWPDDAWPMSVYSDLVGERPRTATALLPDLSAQRVTADPPARTDFLA
jgi:predicted choloylglycine hydrolase